MKFLKKAKERTALQNPDLKRAVSDIIEDVRQNGDASLIKYNKKFDGSSRERMRVDAEEIRAARAQVAPADLEDMREAARNIRAFAEAQRETLRELHGFSPKPGLALGHRHIPVSAALCYVPGGGYPLYSTALMLAVTARAAGVRRVAACSPVMKGTNSIHPRTLAAMDAAGADEIYAVGGAQAVAAFTCGTEQIKPVDMIVGPGNAFVTEAKRQCYGEVGIDFLAGPSEVLILADETAEPDFIAADILAQCEHDPMAQGILVSTDRVLAERATAAVQERLKSLETAATAEKSWADYGEVVLADSLDEAIDYVNARAPEHLEIQTAEGEALMDRLHNYGSLFIGPYAAEVFGDYASGPNHTLPTMRAARYTGGVWVGTFLKTCAHQSIDVRAMPHLLPLCSRLARGEGLAAHARAAEIRGTRP